jgi:endonuclease/exonuclease/phosphatase family metal-dependent hydrolase
MKKTIVFFTVAVCVFVFSGWSFQDHQANNYEAFANGRWGPKKIVVMTRNIYVGGNVDRIIEADPEDQLEALLLTLDELQTTDFPERAIALAKEIKWKRPHLVGLQEVSLIDINLPALGYDFTLDYEAIFMSTLQAMGLDYYIAGKIKNTDVVLPLDAVNYVALEDYDVVLARNDVLTSSVEAENYVARFAPPSLGGQQIIRGYVAVDAEIDSRKYRFVNTHLEPFIDAVKMGQAVELMGALASETLPIILLGDVNAAAPNDPVYQFIVGSDFVDIWPRNKRQNNPDGFTSGHDSDLLNTEVLLDKRIDIIFVRSHVWHNSYQDIGPVIAFVVGDELKDRTPSGLWPSDHAGVLAQLKIPMY